MSGTLPMRTDLFDFDLPESCIALRPAEPRGSARLLAVRGETGTVSDHLVSDLPALLEPGDALVFNDTRVIPAALDGIRDRGGITASVSFNLTKRLDAHRWNALARPAKRLAAGDTVQFTTHKEPTIGKELAATIESRGDAGEVTLAFSLSGAVLDAAIDAYGHMPLPPYIAGKRPADDGDLADYQTMFADQDGAVAAPTAGLHFTPRLMEDLRQRGVTRHTVTLHVGAGTFLPVKAGDTADHKMHAEWGHISVATAAALNAARARGGRIVAVGTTSLRLIESAANDSGEIQPFSGETAIFITPGYRFRAVDGLITNFHLPRSTLFILVAAFSGLETMKSAYSHAVQFQYRFYSYGDACLLFPRTADATD